MRLGIHEIIKEVAKARTPEDKAFTLRRHDSGPLRIILKYAYDPRVRWILPEGDPPYKPLVKDEWINSEYILMAEARTLYLFVEGGADINRSVPMRRREQKFVELLEACHPDDALAVLGAKNRNIPEIPEAIVRMAFPDLLYPAVPTTVPAVDIPKPEKPKKVEDPVKRAARLAKKREEGRAHRARLKAERLGLAAVSAAVAPTMTEEKS